MAPATPLTAGDICTRSAVFTDAAMLVGDAARPMRTHDVGSLVVVQEQSPGRRIVVGMVTDRDPHAMRVGELMGVGRFTLDDVLPVVAGQMHALARAVGATGGHER